MTHENQDHQQTDYDAPALTRVGSLEDVTKSTDLPNNDDFSFPNNDANPAITS